MLWCRFSTASLISSSSGSEVLSVADLLDHFADASISVDLLQEIVSGDEARVPTFTRRVHLLLQGATEDLRDLRAAHPTHGRQHRTVVDVGEERATRRRLRAPAGQLQDLLLARPIWERHLHQPIQAAGSHQRRVDGVGTDGGADDEEAREVLEPVELLTEGRPQPRRASRACAGGRRCSRESALASSRKTTPRPWSLATERISGSSSPVFGPNFEVRFMSFR